MYHIHIYHDTTVTVTSKTAGSMAYAIRGGLAQTEAGRHGAAGPPVTMRDCIGLHSISKRFSCPQSSYGAPVQVWVHWVGWAQCVFKKNSKLWWFSFPNTMKGKFYYYASHWIYTCFKTVIRWLFSSNWKYFVSCIFGKCFDRSSWMHHAEHLSRKRCKHPSWFSIAFELALPPSTGLQSNSLDTGMGSSVFESFYFAWSFDFRRCSNQGTS